MKVDWSAQNDKPDHQPGIYHARARDVEDTKSAAGNRMFKIIYENIEDKTFLVVDYIVYRGKAWQYFGQKKAIQLGFGESDLNIDAEDIEGRSVFLHLVNETYEGVTRLKVCDEADEGGWSKGYANRLPAGSTLGPIDPKIESSPNYTDHVISDDSDVPF